MEQRFEHITANIALDLSVSADERTADAAYNIAILNNRQTPDSLRFKYGHCAS